MHLIISTSLNPNSRSRILANAANAAMKSDGHECELMDLAELKLPLCDAGSCFADPNAQKLSSAISSASSILVAAPIYNYDVSSACKNMIELTGKAWTEKVVGFMVAAGGNSSYMAVMGLANSLMLDFRCLIIPRFVYAAGDSFAGNDISEPEVETRINELTQTAVRLGAAF